MRKNWIMGIRSMKYMGSKRSFLSNGLGQMIQERSIDFKRIVDLFSGSASVSWYAAENIDLPVLAIDLQEYSSVLANSIIKRTTARDPDYLITEWLDKVKVLRTRTKYWD